MARTNCVGYFQVLPQSEKSSSLLLAGSQSWSIKDSGQLVLSERGSYCMPNSRAVTFFNSTNTLPAQIHRSLQSGCVPDRESNNRNHSFLRHCRRDLQLDLSLYDEEASFEPMDGDDDFSYVVHRKLLRRRHVRKYQLQKEREEAEATSSPTAHRLSKRKATYYYDHQQRANEAIPKRESDSIGNKEQCTDFNAAENDELSPSSLSSTPCSSTPSPKTPTQLLFGETTLFFSPVKPPKKRKA